jgi:hypothetical protein
VQGWQRRGVAHWWCRGLKGSEGRGSCTVGWRLGVRYDSKRRKGTDRHASSLKRDIDGSAAPVWQCSCEGRVGLVGPKASPGRGGSIGPAHGDGEAVRRLGDGEPRWKTGEGRQRHLPEVETGQLGLKQVVGGSLLYQRAPRGKMDSRKRPAHG